MSKETDSSAATYVAAFFVEGTDFVQILLSVLRGRFLC